MLKLNSLNGLIRNKMTLNTSKTKHVIIPRKPEQTVKVSNISILMNGDKLNDVKSFKYLEFEIDYTLSIDSMVDKIYAKAKRKLYMLKHIRRKLYMLKHIRYGVSRWG